MENLKITTERLQIRNLRPSDLEHFHEYRSKPEVVKYQSFDILSIEEAREFIAEQSNKQFGQAGEWVQYGIENKTTSNLIGDCAIRLQLTQPRIAEIGITISWHEQNKGYARESLLGIMAFLFGAKGIHRVVEIVDAKNIASINLLKGIGFRQEGYFVENIFFKGRWGSELQFAMLKREWEAR
ncbi:MAG: GNAT family N-acetyltransferase [Ferruginibacter sp.]